MVSTLGIQNLLMLTAFFFSKTYWVSNIFYPSCLFPTKVSILLFYHRLFPNRRFTIALYVVGVVAAAWYLAVLGTAIFQCTPVQFAWNKRIEGGHCIPGVKSLIGNLVPNVATDLAIMLLPMPIIWNLHLPTAQKWSVSGMFLLGGL